MQGESKGLIFHHFQEQFGECSEKFEGHTRYLKSVRKSLAIQAGRCWNSRAAPIKARPKEGQMKRFSTVTVALLAIIAFAPTASANGTDEAEIRSILDRFAKAFQDRDMKTIMAMYAPGDVLVAYDVVAPLQYAGFDAYRKDYESFLSQYEGPISLQYRDMHVGVSGDVGYAFGLERMSGTLKGGSKSDMWLRFTSIFRKINGRWKDVHDHISVPADFETGKARLDLQP
jgi:ketosteroid isomerase-like protein